MGSEARTRLAFGGVLAVTLITFGQLFAGGDYAGPALLAALSATGISMLCRRLGAGPWLTAWASLTAMAAYLCLVFEPAELFYGLPTPAAAAGIAGSVRRAVTASSADFAPVPLRPGYVIMTVAGMWACATLGEIATFRWRRPLLAGLGPTVLVAFLMIVGEDSIGTALVLAFIAALLTYWALESTHRLRSWGRWVGAWTNREGDSDGVTGRVARRMGLGAVAAAIAAPLIVPAFGSGLLTWRTHVEGGPGNGAGSGSGPGGGGGAINPFVDLQPKLLEQTDAELFRVEAEAPSYWRLLSLPDFDGRLWTQGDSEARPLDGDTVAGERPPELTRTLDQAYELTGLTGRFAPAAERPFVVTEGSDQFGADDETRHLEASDGDVSGLDYSVRSLLPELKFEELRVAQVGGLGELEDDYLELPSSIDVRIANLAARWVRRAGATTDLESLVALQDRFQNSGGFLYAENVAPQDDDGYLYRFLTQTRAGYCQQYATAFAVMARALGYPTRVSVGFLPGNGDPDNEGTFIVRGTHAHAWPEVYFEDYGWVIFEPTPRSIATEPGYTREAQVNGNFEGNVFSDPDISGGLSLDGRNNPSVGEGSIGCPPELSQAECEANLSNPAANSPSRDPEDDFAWQERFAVIWRASLVALALFLVLVPLAKGLRTRLRYGRAATPSEVTAAAFAQFLDDASELSLVRAPSESAIAYTSRLARRRVVAELQAGRLARLYEQAEYSAPGTTEEQAGEAKRLAKLLRRSLWDRASWWMRLRRLFSPTGLIAGARRGARPRLRPRAASTLLD
ncbi:MAG: transglutaminase TgpA family protein [Actinomycetota bacterium]